jgi:hypothetical protein
MRFTLISSVTFPDDVRADAGKLSVIDVLICAMSVISIVNDRVLNKPGCF